MSSRRLNNYRNGKGRNEPAVKNILIVKMSSIGDVIHALPVSYAIKKTYPDAT